MVGEIDGDTGRNTMNTQGKIEPKVTKFYQIQHVVFVAYSSFYRDEGK